MPAYLGNEKIGLIQERGGVNEVEWVDLTVTNLTSDAIYVDTSKTQTEIRDAAYAGRSVIYKLVIPVDVSGFAAGIYYFRPLWVSKEGINIYANAFMDGIDYSLEQNNTSQAVIYINKMASRDYVSTRLGGLSFVALTQAEYDALVEKDADTFYVIKAE